ncbi:capsid cement protein [Actinomadura opuntiae]|uniref:capsid cement protein n=1 Tax=Actinomadura sp. OS1-43 TaxID=604315 RepID=UPI00255B3B5D|nr:capsid cement protein [Actinomadura sp. OS1-43]MDL4812809.1 DUF2190 family protein [Actinomadura sp. OS1-43]
MTDYIPVFEPATAVTLTASAPISAGQLVEVSGDGTIGPAGADSAKYVGVAAHAAVNGQRLVVWPRGMVHESIASGAIAAGAGISAAAAGAVAAAGAGPVLGIALTTAANAARVRWVAA